MRFTGFFIAILLIVAPAAPGAADYTIAPFLTNVTTSSIDVCFQSEDDLPALIHYGPSAEYGSQVSVAGQPFDTLTGQYTYFDDPVYESVVRYAYCGQIEGLEADTLYHYSVEFDGEQTEDREFATAPGSGFPFSFVVYGDSRSDPLYPLGVPNRFHESVIETMGEYAFDFFMNVGDIVHDGYDIRLWDVAQGIIAPISAEYPYYPILGNHEDRGEEGVEGIDVYEKLFSNPGEASGSGSELYYSFEYANAHYTVIDSNADIEPDSEQGQWIAADLQAAGDNPDIEWKFMFMHHPPYSSSVVGIGDERQQVTRRYIPAIAEEYGVAIVFTGHQHSYERSCKDGVYYIVTGNGGALPSFVGAPILNQYSEYFEGNFNFSNFGFCHLEIAGDYLVLQSVIADGTVIDVLEIGEAPVDDDADDDVNDDADDDADDDDADDDVSADDDDNTPADAGGDDDDDNGCGC